MRAAEALRQDLLRRLLEPGVAALGLEERGHGLDALLGADGLAAVVTVEDGDRQTPAALTGDAPVAALTDHGGHALLAPGGEPADVLAGADGILLEGVDRAEPLRGGAEDDGVLAAPAVRVAVDNVLRGEESAALLHVLEDDGVGFLCGEAGVLAGVFRVAALIVHGDDHLGAVAQAGLVVVGAEAGRGVHAAGAGIHGDVVGRHQQAGLGQEGMLREHALEEEPLMGLHDLPAVDLAGLHDGLDQGFGHDEHLARGDPHDGVAVAGAQRDAEVAGQRPDRGGPDQEEEPGAVEMGELAQIVRHRELHVHGGDGVVLILDLGLGQRGLVLGAPVDRLEPLVDVPVLVHLAEHAHFLRLEALVHGQVGVLPVGDHAETLEALALPVNVLFGVGVAGGAEIGHGHGLVVELLLLDDGALDGHAVVVPAGDVGRVVPAHRVGADDEVLDGLVERVAHVDIAVGEGRAVVQREARMAFVLFQHLMVEIELLPVPEHLRLARGQTGAHGEVGLRQVHGGFEVL